MKWMMSVLFLLLTTAAHAEVLTEERSYQVGDNSFRGYLAIDDRFTPPLPGVLVVHEWWGLNDYVRERARMLAKLGYAAFALDMYGDGITAEHPQQAGAFAKASLASLPQAESRFNTALTLMAKDNRVRAESMAAVGYCYGGAVVLHMARMGAPLKAVASFHGSLAPKAAPLPANSPVRIAVFHGDNDAMVPAEQVEVFQREMEQANADYTLVNYPDAQHGFTNPASDQAAREFGLPVGYDPAADEDSWQRLKAFLEKNLK